MWTTFREKNGSLRAWTDLSKFRKPGWSAVTLTMRADVWNTFCELNNDIVCGTSRTFRGLKVGNAREVYILEWAVLQDKVARTLLDPILEGLVETYWTCRKIRMIDGAYAGSLLPELTMWGVE